MGESTPPGPPSGAPVGARPRCRGTRPAPVGARRRSRAWPAPTPLGVAATPCSPSAWPGRCSSRSTSTRPAGGSRSTWCSPSPRSRWRRRSSARPSTASRAGAGGSSSARSRCGRCCASSWSATSRACSSTPRPSACWCCGKSYTISKSAVVPGTVRSDEELVEANSKLTVLVGAGGRRGRRRPAASCSSSVAPGGRWPSALIVFARRHRARPAAAADHGGRRAPGRGREGGAAQRRHRARRVGHGLDARRSSASCRSCWRSPSRRTARRCWELGLVAAAAQVGFFLGAVRRAPRCASWPTEEHILVGALVVTAVGGRRRPPSSAAWSARRCSR